MRRTVLLLLLIASAASASHRDVSRYDRVLLPFFGYTAGVGGAWSAEWWFRNDGDISVDVFPLAVYCGLFCPPDRRYYLVESIGPHHTPTRGVGDVLPMPRVPLSPPVESTPHGVLLYVERDKAAQVLITGFLGHYPLAGAPRRSTSSALRAIHESRFRKGTKSIFVPVEEGTRYSLRIFALPETTGVPAVAVRSFAVAERFPPQEDEALLGEASATLVTPPSGLPPGCYGDCALPPVPFKPAVADLRLANPRPSLMRIEIAPVSPDLRWWAVVSATLPSGDVQLFEVSDF